MNKTIVGFDTVVLPKMETVFDTLVENPKFKDLKYDREYSETKPEYCIAVSYSGDPVICQTIIDIIKSHNAHISGYDWNYEYND